ncbi:hypothetical protein QQS21_007707 [Conoideocrella luteorostrata]|uniref:NAD(P)-binding protein n=1 Tax=Conoideocrella luteorostrata TaxID=1105319 RepID=A0AAJ0CN15_9HYPO|nr:hypothetical protein QQS21_007707 [Conoideocrella luteorostrata]
MSRVALIFGYGANIGKSVAASFAAKGYKIAAVSRSAKHSESSPDYLSIKADLSDPSSVEGVFARVTSELGHPSVVIYNSSATSVKNTDPIAEQLSALQSDNNVNIVSPYIAAQLATKSFAQLPAEPSKTFIYTGNKLNFIVVRPLLGLGVGKSGGAHLMHYLAEEYRDQGYKFYFADERKADGAAVYGAIDGPAHGEFYTHLAEKKEQGPWLATFVKDQGYTKFSDSVV